MICLQDRLPEVKVLVLHHTFRVINIYINSSIFNISNRFRLVRHNTNSSKCCIINLMGNLFIISSSCSNNSFSTNNSRCSSSSNTLINNKRECLT